jgi:hypothetical protein
VYLYFVYFAVSYGYQVIPSVPDACSCSCFLTRYTDYLLTSTLRHLDFSKDFMEKGGFMHCLLLHLFGCNINAS